MEHCFRLDVAQVDQNRLLSIFILITIIKLESLLTVSSKKCLHFIMIYFYSGVVLYKIQDGEMNFDAARASCAQDQGFTSYLSVEILN